MATQKEILEDTHDKVIKLSAVLLGVNGAEGLCDRFENLAKSHYTLKRNFYAVISFLVGSGVLGAGIWRLLS